MIANAPYLKQFLLGNLKNNINALDSFQEMEVWSIFC